MPSGFIPFSPIDNAGFDMFLIVIIFVISSFIGILLPGYFFGPILLFVHKYTIGLKMDYGIQDREQSKKYSDVFKGFFPSLMTINFALSLSENESIQTLIMGKTAGNPIFIRIMTFNVLSAMLIGIALAIFSAVWFLLDAAIVYSNKNKVTNKAYPVEVRAVGSWLNYLLKGYAGISVIFTYYQFIGVEIFQEVDLSAIIFYSTWPFFPILFTLLVAPVFILLDVTFKHRKKYIQKIAKRLNIAGPLEDPLNIKL
jgi:hypothetical protein